MTRKQDSAKARITAEDLKQMLAEDGDLLKTIIEQTVQQVLEAEMDEALQASKGERSENRLGYRSGYYGRTLVTRVGKSRTSSSTIGWSGPRPTTTSRPTLV